MGRPEVKSILEDMRTYLHWRERWFYLCWHGPRSHYEALARELEIARNDLVRAMMTDCIEHGIPIAPRYWSVLVARHQHLKTFKEIGAMEHVSISRARQLHAKSVNRLARFYMPNIGGLM